MLAIMVEIAEREIPERFARFNPQTETNVATFVSVWRFRRPNGSFVVV